ncbi:MAG: thioesterase domain-containing protein [Sideroxydans sp.]|nr:thioesterase domain-containing protein [Sideroxydans sp.]
MTHAAALEQTLHRDIPITREMGIRVAAYDGRQLRLTAPLSANINDKGTAFGGSLYSVAVLCGWSMLHLKLREAGLPHNVVIQEANVRYLLPVEQNIEAECQIDDEAFAQLLISLNKHSRARLPLSVVIKQNDRPAVEFSGRYVVHK